MRRMREGDRVRTLVDNKNIGGVEMVKEEKYLNLEDVLDIKLEDVETIYLGKEGCRCGCRGTYAYNPLHKEYAEKNRGYGLSDDEVSETNHLKGGGEVEKNNIKLLNDDVVEQIFIVTIKSSGDKITEMGLLNDIAGGLNVGKEVSVEEITDKV